MADKVKFGLSKAYYAVATIAATGAATYTTPVALPGAVSLSLSPRGDRTPFYADNIEYYISNRNNGYEGTLELALVPDSFREDILGEYVDSNKIASEQVGVDSAHFALLFQFEGDTSERLHVVYNCIASRTDIASSTITDTTEPQTETLNITASPIYVAALEKWFTKARTNDDTTDTIKAAWFTSVQVPTTT